MSEIKEKVVEIIVDKLGVDAAEVKDEASFTNDLSADSLDTVELIMELEKQFDVTIPDTDAEKIQTVGDAVAYIENAHGQISELPAAMGGKLVEITAKQGSHVQKGDVIAYIQRPESEDLFILRAHNSTGKTKMQY